MDMVRTLNISIQQELDSFYVKFLSENFIPTLSQMFSNKFKSSSLKHSFIAGFSINSEFVAPESNQRKKSLPDIDSVSSKNTVKNIFKFENQSIPDNSKNTAFKFNLSNLSKKSASGHLIKKDSSDHLVVIVLQILREFFNLKHKDVISALF